MAQHWSREEIARWVRQNERRQGVSHPFEKADPSDVLGPASWEKQPKKHTPLRPNTFENGATQEDQVFLRQTKEEDNMRRIIVSRHPLSNLSGPSVRNLPTPKYWRLSQRRMSVAQSSRAPSRSTWPPWQRWCIPLYLMGHRQEVRNTVSKRCAPPVRVLMGRILSKGCAKLTEEMGAYSYRRPFLFSIWEKKMAYYYTDPNNESDPYKLPDVETFYLANEDLRWFGLDEEGWYFWWCSPGYLPTSYPIGPFCTEQEALEGARDSVYC